MAQLPDDNGFGTINQSQRDKPQANDIAEDALHRTDDPSEDSEKVASGVSVMPLDEPDLVDRMEQMVRSGRIDTDAFAGERNDDDEESELGELADEGDDDPMDVIAR
ncbi:MULTISPECIES: hypothetical protein [Pseudomonadota]|jgi:hypothetical protein|uniref:hypothetical protein n=1 Tax=Pseudomonadota TaxID=1224 RepID=UPI000769A709|nr:MULTISPECIES: hypothetical protein [Pseudomonadota]MAF62273.1 hypothetical protein [Blastomonas sp.]MBA4780816.1 hypothetical protein [Blastomonas sp.]|tara:strand:+ start:128 stop:448 length:321 start_codon:yes stop_codon:yes gene_type:complete